MRDLQYLVTHVWDGRSVLSKHKNLVDLVLSRWILCEEWSPCNCLLITKNEAKSHAKVVDVEKVCYYFIGCAAM